jgi:putative hydrolase of the HAD superfamily
MSLSNITTWLFDLDNTLYSATSDIFPLIHQRMSEFIMLRLGVDRAEAEKQRADYFHRYGTTMRGLMEEHKVDPTDFMDFVHNVPLDSAPPSEKLRNTIATLKGRKIIFTNADRRHATRVLNHLGLANHFPDIFDITDGAFVCKPNTEPYQQLLKQYGLKAEECCMIDDMEANLKPAAGLGMRTLWIRHEAEWLRHKPKSHEHYPHCHYTTDDLIPFFEKLNAGNA